MEIRKLNGLGTAFRRKVGREFSKSFTGIEGTATQQNLLAAGSHWICNV
jgi:hypothetical protein